MKVILKSGVIIPNVQSSDKTKSPMGLWVWANKQAIDQLLSFEGITIRSSQIAAIVEEEQDNSYQKSLNNATKLFEQPQYSPIDSLKKITKNIDITDDDLPF